MKKHKYCPFPAKQNKQANYIKEVQKDAIKLRTGYSDSAYQGIHCQSCQASICFGVSVLIGQVYIWRVGTLARKVLIILIIASAVSLLGWDKYIPYTLEHIVGIIESALPTTPSKSYLYFKYKREVILIFSEAEYYFNLYWLIKTRNKYIPYSSLH